MIKKFVARQDLTKGVREGLIPVGVMVRYGGSTASPPGGFLACNGAVVNRADYDKLFDVISTSFNTGGETSIQFRLPNVANYIIKY